MKTMVSYKGRYYLAEQDRRGKGEEADIVIYKGSTEIYRTSYKKLANEYELRIKTVKIMRSRDGEEV